MTQPNMLDLAPSLQEPGKRLVDAGELKLLFASLFDTITSITVAGTNAATATPLPSGGFIWVTSGSAPAGIVMSQGALGQQVRIFADTATGIAVYAPPGGGVMGTTSNSSAAAATFNLGGGTVATMICLGPGLWKRVS